MKKWERVVVTGMGVASPLGSNTEKFWKGLVEGRSAIDTLEGTDFSDLSSKVGGVVWDFDENKHFDRKEARRMSRSSQLGLVAAEEAVSDAKLHNGDVNDTQVGILVGSSIGGYAASDQYFKSFHESGRLSPYTIPVSMNVGPGANISIKYGYQGPLMNVDAACSTAAHSIGNAFNMIRSGNLQVAVT
ncbi:MAG TPA: beta-ketoacyl synthase N-terminal-like domain-containing protein, partial [Anaerolineales bacterium]|nr:beta-ketoacyl synthase N-terminal-like domain-containing protein [Anaerolineales bacterium]